MSKLSRKLNKHSQLLTMSIDYRGIAKLACRFSRDGARADLEALLGLREQGLGIDIDAFGPCAQNPAMLAVVHSRLECLALLGSAGARFDKKGRGGLSALDLAQRAVSQSAPWDRARAAESVSIIESFLIQAPIIKALGATEAPPTEAPRL